MFIYGSFKSCESFKRITSFFLLLTVSLSLLCICDLSYFAYLSSDTYISAINDLTEKEIVIIDAGHGGEDPGAIGVNGAYEKDINLSVALTLGEILKGEGFVVVYTRTDDRMLYGEGENVKGIRKLSDLKNRCKIANEYNNAILVSIHMNSYSDGRYDGFQAYYSDNNEQSLILSKSITDSIKNGLQTDNRRNPKSGQGMYLLDHVDNPAVLLECGFMSNTEEYNISSFIR